MGFGEAVKTCFSKYFTLRGRARRSEYWWFYLFTILLGIVAGIVDLILGTDEIGLVGLIAALVTIIPTITAQVRRLHDTGRSGWWVGGAFLAAIAFLIILSSMFGVSGFDNTSDEFLIKIGLLGIVFGLAFLIYGVTMLVFMCLDSHQGDNKYGPNPKYDTHASVFN